MIRTIFYTIWCVLYYYTVILKHIDLNVTEFLPKIQLFPEDCTSSGLSQDSQLLNMVIFSWEYTSICAIQI